MSDELLWLTYEGCKECGESIHTFGGCKCDRERPKDIMIYNMKIGEWSPVTEKITFVGEFLDAIAEQITERSEDTTK